MFTIRKVKMDDMKDIYENANEPEVRQFSINSEPIKWEEHVKWFERVLNDPLILFYAAYNENGFVGQVRFNLLENGSALVSISMGKKSRGKGYSRELLLGAEKMAKQEKKIEILEAYILPDNAASTALFQKSGYVKTGEETVKGKLLNKYTKE